MFGQAHDFNLPHSALSFVSVELVEHARHLQVRVVVLAVYFGNQLPQVTACMQVTHDRHMHGLRHQVDKTPLNAYLQLGSSQGAARRLPARRAPHWMEGLMLLPSGAKNEAVLTRT